MPVQITDHSKDTATELTVMKNVDEQCLNAFFLADLAELAVVDGILSAHGGFSNFTEYRCG